MPDAEHPLEDSGIEVEASGLRLTFAPETEAHMPSRKGGPSQDERPAPETEAQASLSLTFRPDATERTIEVCYRPSGTPGEPPEVQLHLYKFFDRRLKRSVRSL